MYTLSASLTYDWATNCGVPGGIPTDRTQYGETLTAANTAAEINSALAGCPSGQYIALAAGTYNIGQLTFAQLSGVTLKGAGAGQTIINTTATRAVVNYEQYFHEEDGIAISSGYTKGSTSIVLASAPSAYFVVGRLIQITQDDSPDVWASGIGVYHRVGFTGSYGMSATRNLRFTSRITAIDGNTITLATEIPIAFTAGLTPKAYPGRATPTSLCGLESLTIYGGGTADRAVYWAQADRCWMKDVETYGFVGTTGVNMFWQSSQCEINRCYSHDVASYPTQADGFSYFLYYGCSCCKVENSISYRVGDSIIVNGSAGNVVVNNYDIDISRSGHGWIDQSQICNHGPHGVMNLFEANVTQRWQNDGYHGSTSHSTLFRNWVHGLCSIVASPTTRRLIDLTRGSYYHNVVGCVLGDASYSPSHYDLDPGESPVSCCYILGYPGMDSVSMAAYTSVAWADWPKSTSVPDADVAGTLTRHANFDYLNDAVVWNDDDHVIADSLYYASKPSWYGTLDYPAIGPDVTGYVKTTPPMWRWGNYTDGGSEDVSELFRDTPTAGGGVGAVGAELVIEEAATFYLSTQISKKRATNAASQSVTYVVTPIAYPTYTNDVDITVTGNPAGSNVTLDPVDGVVSPGEPCTITVTTTSVTAGTYNLTITGEEVVP